MHPDVCLRLTEVLSYVRLSELLMLTGEAIRLRKELLAHFVGTADSIGPTPPRYSANFWDTARSKVGRFYPPVQIIRKPRSRRS